MSIRMVGLVRMSIRMVGLVRMSIRMVGQVRTNKDGLPGQDANQDGCLARIFGMAYNRWLVLRNKDGCLFQDG